MSKFTDRTGNIDFRINKSGLLTSTIQAVLPARLQCWYLQLQQISSLKESHSYQQKIVLNYQSKTELLWWTTNLDFCNGQSLIQPLAQVLIQRDASTKGWGATCNDISTGGMWSAQEIKYHINILELLPYRHSQNTEMSKQYILKKAIQWP